MKLPVPLDVPHTPAGSRGRARGSAVTTPDVQPMVSIGCLTGCVGDTAYSCLQCGSDLACWARCAGPASIPCLSRCYGQSGPPAQ